MSISILFANKKEQLKKMFSMFPVSFVLFFLTLKKYDSSKAESNFFLDLQRNQGEDDERSRYEKDRIAHAKRIMKPFFLRRLKSEVLTDLPQKSEEVLRVSMTQQQQEAYFELVSDYKQRAKEVLCQVF